MGAEWIGPGRLLVRPDARRGDIARLVAEADIVQFDAPLSAAVSEVVAESLRSRPQVERYVYRHYGRALDGELDFPPRVRARRAPFAQPQRTGRR